MYFIAKAIRNRRREKKPYFYAKAVSSNNSLRTHCIHNLSFSTNAVFIKK